MLMIIIQKILMDPWQILLEYSKNGLIYGMMPHPERTMNSEIYYIYIDVVYKFNIQNIFCKSINELMKSEHISYKSTRMYLKNMYLGNMLYKDFCLYAGIIYFIITVWH